MPFSHVPNSSSNRPARSGGGGGGNGGEADLGGRDRFRPFLLQRLTDPWLERHTILPGDRVPPASASLNQDQYRDAVVVDLGRLLNTIAPPAWTGRAGTAELASSVVNFGLPDVALLRLDDIEGDRLCSLIRQAIARFEPRILAHTLEVKALEHSAGASSVAIVIEGTLWALPAPQPIRLRSTLNDESQQWDIAEY